MILYTLKYVPEAHNREPDGSVRHYQFHSGTGSGCENLTEALWIDKEKMDKLLDLHHRYPNVYWKIYLLTKEQGMICESLIARPS